MHESIVGAINTSGRAVLFAGTTVCIAILGLIALGVSFFNGMAVATALAVAFTMAASLTLLPALLSLFGLKVVGWFHAWVGHIRPYEHRLIFGALLLTLAVALWRQWRLRR